jgi:hypothetical protein
VLRQHLNHIGWMAIVPLPLNLSAKAAVCLEINLDGWPSVHMDECSPKVRGSCRKKLFQKTAYRLFRYAQTVRNALAGISLEFHRDDLPPAFRLFVNHATPPFARDCKINRGRLWARWSQRREITEALKRNLSLYIGPLRLQATPSLQRNFIARDLDEKRGKLRRMGKMPSPAAGTEKR